MLGQVGDVRAVEPLISALLNDSDLFVRKLAALSLEQIGDKRAIEPLLDVFKQEDEDSKLRSTVAWVLSKIGDRRIVESFIDAIGNSKINTDSAVTAILRTVFNFFIRPNKGLRQVRTYEISTIQVSFPRGSFRTIVTNALGELGDPRAVEPLIQLLKEGLFDERQQAARALAKIGDVRAVEPLIQALKQPWPTTRSEAAKALEKFADVRAVEPLIETLKDEYEEVRNAAAKALGKLAIADRFYRCLMPSLIVVPWYIFTPWRL
jgi:HEAT repeat protein